MAKDMQKDFMRAIERADLFAEQAMVATLGFDPAAAQATAQQNAFLTHLRAQGVGHEKIYQAQDVLTFAVAREKDLEAENIRRTVTRFFAKQENSALTSQAYYQKYDSDAAMKADTPRREGAVRRRIARIVKAF